MRGAWVLALLTWLVASPAAASTLFSDGFEACCTVGGTVSGLQGSGLVLRLDAAGDEEILPLASNGPYRFAARLPVSVSYDVTVQAQPTGGPPCEVRNASGTMPAGPVFDIDVVCSDALVWDQGPWGSDWQ